MARGGVSTHAGATVVRSLLRIRRRLCRLQPPWLGAGTSQHCETPASRCTCASTPPPTENAVWRAEPPLALDSQLGRDPREEQRGGEQDDREHVVVGPVIGRCSVGGMCVAAASSRALVERFASAYSDIANGVFGAFGFVRGSVWIYASNAGRGCGRNRWR